MPSALLGVLVDGHVHTRFVATSRGVLAPRGAPLSAEAAVDRIADATRRGGRWFSAHDAVPDDGRRTTGILTAFLRVTRAL